MSNASIPIMVLGMTWYEEQDFQEIKRLMADGHTLHRTYAEWFHAASIGEKQQIAAGRHVVRAVIKPAEFKQWCQERGLNLDSNARTAFGNWVARQHIQDANEGNLH